MISNSYATESGAGEPQAFAQPPRRPGNRCRALASGASVVHRPRRAMSACSARPAKCTGFVPESIATDDGLARAQHLGATERYYVVEHAISRTPLEAWHQNLSDDRVP
jgi:hypothetical protein